MPTGLTALIADGDTSAKNFILRCARGFGALSFMRDEPLSAPIPETIPEETYYKECYERECKRLEELKAMTSEDIHRETQKWYEDVKTRFEKTIEHDLAENAKYDAMIKKVEAWDCSINPDLQPLKNYALDQLRISKTDPEWAKHHLEEIVPLSDEAWYRYEMESCLRDISHFKEKIEKDKQWRADCNRWLSDLRKSLEGIDGET